MLNSQLKLLREGLVFGGQLSASWEISLEVHLAHEREVLISLKLQRLVVS